MTEYYHIVPWYNSEEWKHVFDEIYSATSTLETKREALRILLIWKARCPSLPSGVESTLTLLEVHLQDANSSSNMLNDNILRLAYSSAVMRFVNHMLDTESAKGNSLYQAAKSLGIPDWIIDMRHDTAHSNNLPSLELLREACAIGLEWLRINYWEKYSECIQDFVTGQVEVDVNKQYKIETLMNFCMSLSICAHPKCQIKHLSAIPNPTMTESIVNDARDLFGDIIDMSNLKSTSVMSLVNIMNDQAKKILKSRDTAVYVKKALLGNDSLFLSRELLDFLGESSTKKKKELGKSYVQCFEIMLTFLHTHDLLLDFILELIRISQCNNYEGFKRRLGALWVSEILKALRRCRDFSHKIKKASEMSRKKKEIKSLFHHWFPNENVNCLLLNLEKPVPEELTNINFIQPIISEYNPLLIIFIKDLLHLIQPNLPKATTEQICNLAKLIATPERSLKISDKIYTVDSLKNSIDINKEPVDSDSDCFEVTESEVTPNETSSQMRFGIWQLATKDVNWRDSPIGQLPWQQQTEHVSPMDTS